MSEPNGRAPHRIASSLRALLMLTALALLTCLGAGTVGGVCFDFSTFVMTALSRLPASQGAAAMQRINVVVLTALVLGPFVRTTVLAVGCVVASFFPFGGPRPRTFTALLRPAVASTMLTVRAVSPMLQRMKSIVTQAA